MIIGATGRRVGAAPAPDPASVCKRHCLAIVCSQRAAVHAGEPRPAAAQRARYSMTTPAAKWKAAERARHKEAGRVAVTHHIYPEDREKVARYIKRLVERTERRRAG